MDIKLSKSISKREVSKIEFANDARTIQIQVTSCGPQAVVIGELAIASEMLGALSFEQIKQLCIELGCTHSDQQGSFRVTLARAGGVVTSPRPAYPVSRASVEAEVDKVIVELEKRAALKKAEILAYA